MIAVFECAARVGSFTDAATELGLTQPAVSRRVDTLEQMIGQKLFDRSANRVALNAAGELLLTAVQSGFNTIEIALEEISRTGPTFLLAANPGFAQQWLVPHLDLLQAVLGDADLHLRLFDRDAELTGDAFDAAVHLIPIAGAPAGSRVLFDERVVPVAAPSFARHTGLNEESRPDELLEVAKLHLDTRERQWMDWTTWFAANGLPWSPSQARMLYNNHALVMNYAVAGQGVALAWRGLVEPMLETGALITVGPEAHRPEMAYQVIPGRSAPADSVNSVTDWLIEITHS